MDWIAKEFAKLRRACTRMSEDIERHRADAAHKLARLHQDIEHNHAELVEAMARVSTGHEEILRVIQENYAMSQQDIDRLRASVEANTSAVQSANALITSIAQQMRDAADDPEEIRALADQLEQNTASLSEAVAANTAAPAAPAAPAAGAQPAGAGAPGATPSANPNLPNT
jgi:septal ring factor EnvC (AmiA/AmiB activator)